MRKHVLFIGLFLLGSSLIAQSQDLEPERVGDKYGFSKNGTLVIDAVYDDAGSFSEGLAPVKKNGKWGYINKTGHSVIPYKYEAAGSFSEGYAVVKMFDKYGFIDAEGKGLTPLKYDKADRFRDGLATVWLADKEGKIDKAGEWLDSDQGTGHNFAIFARTFVENDVNQWQRKGKFEKTADWQRRVTDQTRKARIDSLFAEAKNAFIAEQRPSISTEFTIGDYDADGEIFMIHDKKFGDLLVPVPIGEAEAFEKSYASIVRDNTYYVDGNALGLAGASFTTPDGKTYNYRRDAKLEFAAVDIDYNFETITYKETAPSGPSNNQIIRNRSIAVGLSDVDLNIPNSHSSNENTFAVIIANENYQRVSTVEFAASDGAAFSKYCNLTLGVPEKNIHLVTDATLVSMWEQVDWITSIAKAYQGEAKIIFYYAGHGIPDEATRDAYLLPIDGNGTNTRTGYKLSELYSRLNEFPTASTVVFLDACFSGTERSGQMLASARGVALKAKEEKPAGNMVVISAASGDETAYPYREKGHGLFTYYLLKKLQDSEGDVTLGELAGYVKDQVGKQSIVENSKSQTPSVIPSGQFVDQWQNVKLK